jgi:hypothetical protein
VNAKYRIKNNINEPVESFLKTRKKSSASTKERSIFTPNAISVIKTLFSLSEKNPLKKIKRDAKAARAKHIVSRRAGSRLNRGGERIPAAVTRRANNRNSVSRRI